jgi:hypothetical protein
MRDESDREVVRIHVGVVHDGQIRDEVILDLVPAQNHLPARVTYLYSNSGGIAMMTDLQYQMVGQDAWYPKVVNTRAFQRDTTFDFVAPTGQNISSTATVKVFQVGGSISDDVFNPVLPAKTVVRGHLAKTIRVGDVPTPVLSITRKEPIRVTAPPAPPKDVASFWFASACIDLLLLGIWLVRRKLRQSYDVVAPTV